MAVEFPAFLTLEHKPDSAAKASFMAEIDKITGDAQGQFTRAFGEIDRVIGKSLSGLSSGRYKFDLDVSGMRQTASEADLAAQRLRAMRDAAVSLAQKTGDTTQTTRTYISALRAQVTEAEQAKSIADAQVTTYTRLQAEMDRTVASNRALAQSYRDTFLEQAKAENYAYRRQQGTNAVFAPGLTAKATDNGASFSALSAMVQAEEDAAQATKAHAAALAQLRSELDPTVAIQQRFNAEMDRADDLLRAGAIGTREYAQAQQLAKDNLQEAYQAQFRVTEGMKRGTDATRNVINSQAALRQATLQSGQQLQDIAISLYSGQQASVVFAQQLPQLAFGLSGLEGSANKTQDRIGKFATFLAGPWGIAVGLAVGVAAGLAAELLGLGDDAEESEKKVYRFSEGLNVLELSARRSADAMRQLADETRNAISQQGDYLNQQAQIAEKAVSDIERRLQQAQADLAREMENAVGFTPDPTEVFRRTRRVGQLRDNIANDKAALEAAREAAAYADLALSQRRVETSLDAVTAATTRYEEAVGRLNARREASLKLDKSGDPLARSTASEYLSRAAYESQLANLQKERDAAIKIARDSKSTSPGASNSGQARLGDMTAVIKQLFPGAVITSTTGGRHVKGSDHYAGRAIDFVPGGGMGRYTTAEVEAMLESAGVDIRRNARGTKQLFGPDRPASKPGDHNDHFHVAFDGSPDPEKIAAAADRAKERLVEFGERSGEAISRITEQFNEQPRLIDRAEQSTRALDDIVKDLEQRKPPGFEKLIAQTLEAKAAIADAFVRPFREMREDAERNVAVQALVLQGREAEATALQRIWQLEEQLGPLTEERRQEIYEIAEAENAVSEALERQREIQSAYLDATRSVRSEVEAILAGQGKFSNFKNIFKQLQGRALTEQLFGDAFRDIDQWVKKNTRVGEATDLFTEATDRAGEAGNFLADEFLRAARKLSDPFGTSGSAAANDNANIIDELYDRASGNGSFLDSSGANAEIVVNGRRSRRTVNDLTPGEYFNQLGDKLGVSMVGALNKKFDTTFFSQFAGVLGGAFAGYATGGNVGGLLGGLKGIVDSQKTELQKSFDKAFGDSGLSGDIGNALKGAQTGTATSGIMKSLGIKTSTTAAQIGGALGAASGIPGADIIASITWGFIGGLFKKTKSGSATIGNLDGSLGISGTGGNSGKYIEAASDGAGGIISSINRIADALGGIVDPSRGSVSLGIRHGDYRVDTTGRGITKKNRGAIDFNDDASAAIAYATYDLIKDGVITGLRATTQRILQTGDDLDAALQKALDFEDVFSQLKEFKDPVGAALDGLDREFTRLKKLFQDSNATTQEYADLEELYNLKRAEAVKQASEQIIGSLKDLRDQLNIGDSGLSLRARLANAQAAYDPLKARVAAGDTTAYDDYAKAAATLLDLQRELYGSQGSYFTLFDEINNLTATAIAAQEAIASASANRDSPFSDSAVPSNDNASVVSAIQTQTSTIAGTLETYLGAINDNIGTLVTQLASGGSAINSPQIIFPNSF